MIRRSLAAVASSACIAFVVVACSDDVASTTTDGNDGKFHPPTNGMTMAEDEACEALHKAIDTTRSTLQCTGTTRTCPSLVQIASGAMCAEYDQGTITGCADYFKQAPDCTELSTRIDTCVYVAIPGSSPKGCPTP